jgi:hypothetical protein
LVLAKSYLLSIKVRFIVISFRPKKYVYPLNKTWIVNFCAFNDGNNPIKFSTKKTFSPCRSGNNHDWRQNHFGWRFFLLLWFDMHSQTSICLCSCLNPTRLDSDQLRYFSVGMQQRVELEITDVVHLLSYKYFFMEKLFLILNFLI